MSKNARSQEVNEDNLDIIPVLYTMILTAFLGMLLWCPTTSWTKLLKCRPEPDTEEEPLGEGSSQAANAVGVQADESTDPFGAACC